MFLGAWENLAKNVIGPEKFACLLAGMTVKVLALNETGSCSKVVWGGYELAGHSTLQKSPNSFIKIKAAHSIDYVQCNLSCYTVNLYRNY